MNMGKRINDITPSEWDSMSRGKKATKKATDQQVGGEHYLKNSGHTQPVEFIQELNLSWCLSNAMKYILRNGSKGEDDLEKAIHYIQLEMQLSQKKFLKFTQERFSEYEQTEDADAELDYMGYLKSNIDDLQFEYNHLNFHNRIHD